MEAERSNKLTVVMVLFLLAAGAIVLSRLISGRWPWAPAQWDLGSLFVPVVVAVCLVAALGVDRSIRRGDAELARWEKTRASLASAPGEGPPAHLRWPSVLFGVEWESRIKGLRGAWQATGRASSAGDANYRALEQVLWWLCVAERLEIPRERAFYRDALRRVAWSIATDLDPTIANY